MCELFGDHSIDRKLTRGDGARMAWPTMGLMDGTCAALDNDNEAEARARGSFT